MFSSSGHAHWVNTLSLNTDYVLRTGAYDHTGKKYEDPAEGTRDDLGYCLTRVILLTLYDSSKESTRTMGTSERQRT